jgi:hypothetical protein
MESCNNIAFVSGFKPFLFIKNEGGYHYSWHVAHSATQWAKDFPSISSVLLFHINKTAILFAKCDYKEYYWTLCQSVVHTEALCFFSTYFLFLCIFKNLEAVCFSSHVGYKFPDRVKCFFTSHPVLCRGLSTWFSPKYLLNRFAGSSVV